MEPVHYLLILATGVVVAVIVWLLSGRPRVRHGLPFTKHPALLTAGEP